MDKHITEIELFELANELISDATQMQTIEKHISICETCKVKLDAEKSVLSLLANNLQVN